MRNEEEIRIAIKEIEESYNHVLEGDFALIQINAPRALMQLEATAKLGVLYWVIGESRPVYDFEGKK